MLYSRVTKKYVTSIKGEWEIEKFAAIDGDAIAIRMHCEDGKKRSFVFYKDDLEKLQTELLKLKVK